jgi:hypothetical protein
MPPAGFEPTIPASERPQTHSLDRAATGTSRRLLLLSVFLGRRGLNIVTEDFRAMPISNCGLRDSQFSESHSLIRECTGNFIVYYTQPCYLEIIMFGLPQDSFE